MSQEHMDAFKRVHEAWNRGDVEAGLRDIAEDVVFLPARSAVEGAYRGHDGLRRFWADNTENFEVFQVSYSEVRDLGGRILAIGTIRIRGRGGGVETDIPTAGVATVDEEGKLARWEDFREASLAMEAAGLRE